METQTRFDLSTAIASWQEDLAAQPDLTPIVRRELETHLRDTVAELQARGLNNEEAFWLARRRVGQPRQLGEEFAKADPVGVWRERVFWGMLGLFVFNLWQSTISSAFFLLNNHGILDAGVLYVRILTLLAAWLPILISAILVARGRFTFKTANRFDLTSRRRLAIRGFLWTGFVGLFHGIAMAPDLPNVMIIAHPIDIWWRLSIAPVWPMMLLGLLLWLMPLRPSSHTKYV